MEKKYKEISRTVISSTASLLETYKALHATTLTPMRDCIKEYKVAEDDRDRFVRAAKQLGWNVIESKGKTYENGVLVW